MQQKKEDEKQQKKLDQAAQAASKAANDIIDILKNNVPSFEDHIRKNETEVDSYFKDSCDLLLKRAKAMLESSVYAINNREALDFDMKDVRTIVGEMTSKIKKIVGK